MWVASFEVKFQLLSYCYLCYLWFRPISSLRTCQRLGLSFHIYLPNYLSGFAISVALLTLEVQVTSFLSSSSRSSLSSLSWEYRLHSTPSSLGITILWFPNLSPDLLHIAIDQVILRGSSTWMTAKINKYHYSRINFDSAYNYKVVTFFHICYFTLNGHMDCIYIALFYSSLIKLIYITKVCIHTHIQTLNLWDLVSCSRTLFSRTKSPFLSNNGFLCNEDSNRKVSNEKQCFFCLWDNVWISEYWCGITEISTAVQ